MERFQKLEALLFSRKKLHILRSLLQQVQRSRALNPLYFRSSSKFVFRTEPAGCIDITEADRCCALEVAYKSHKTTDQIAWLKISSVVYFRSLLTTSRIRRRVLYAELFFVGWPPMFLAFSMSVTWSSLHTACKTRLSIDRAIERTINFY